MKNENLEEKIAVMQADGEMSEFSRADCSIKGINKYQNGSDVFYVLKDEGYTPKAVAEHVINDVAVYRYKSCRILADNKEQNGLFKNAIDKHISDLQRNYYETNAIAIGSGTLMLAGIVASFFFCQPMAIPFLIGMVPLYSIASFKGPKDILPKIEVMQNLSGPEEAQTNKL